MIVGTAGHIDHGKTTLVRALTGIDTSRLKEERARGISIELGYAYTPLENGEVLGFIDVPGHERLVHTMVAGACGIDFVLLVIAADDGVMPQTREHLVILELLGVARGALALTKVDRVSEEHLRAVRAHSEALLAATPLAHAPVFEINSTDPTDTGTRALRGHLHEVALHFPPRRDRRLFRLAIDRVFTLSGHGTIVTGTAFAGEVRPGDDLVVMPSGRAARVRSIHAQNRATESGQAGQRCALNLAGVETTEVTRGDWLADPHALAPTTRIDATLRLLGASASDDDARKRPSARGTLSTWMPLHVHLGTAHQVAHVVPLQPPGAAGGSARVQLVFAKPMCAMPGDRFIVRDAQAVHTIGGGMVLDPYAPARRRRSAERHQQLDDLEILASGGDVAALVRSAAHGLRMSDLVRLSGLPPEQIGLPDDAKIIAAAQERFVLDRVHWLRLRDRAMMVLRDFQTRMRDEPGLDVGRWRRVAVPDLDDRLWRVLVSELIDQRCVMRRGPWLSTPEHSPMLSNEDQALLCTLQPLMADGGFDPPWVRELATATRVPEERVRQVLGKALRHGIVYQIVHDLFYDRESVARLAVIAGRLAETDRTVSAARFRDAVGLGRKRAIQILEFFDRVGYTRRVKDAHVLRPDSGWTASMRAVLSPEGKAHAPGGASGLQTQEGALDASW